MAGVTKTDWVWMDGEFVAWEDATVHILTHTLHYGFGVFEGTRAYQRSDGGTSVFRLDDHLGRLRNSAHIMQLDMQYSPRSCVPRRWRLVARNKLESCYIRHLVYIGQGTMGLYPGDDPSFVYAITTWPWGAYLGEEGLSKGVRCKISSFNRPYPNSAMTKAKAVGNYVNSILAKREAVALGYQEALMLDLDGNVAEGSGENLFMVRNGKLMTPPLNSVLEGVTRRTMLELAAFEGLRSAGAHLHPGRGLHGRRAVHDRDGSRTDADPRGRRSSHRTGRARADHQGSAGHLLRRRRW